MNSNGNDAGLKFFCSTDYYQSSLFGNLSHQQQLGHTVTFCEDHSFEEMFQNVLINRWVLHTNTRTCVHTMCTCTCVMQCFVQRVGCPGIPLQVLLHTCVSLYFPPYSIVFPYSNMRILDQTLHTSFSLGVFVASKTVCLLSLSVCLWKLWLFVQRPSKYRPFLS